MEGVNRSLGIVRQKLSELHGHGSHKASWRNLFLSPKVVEVRVRGRDVDFLRAEVFLADLNVLTQNEFADVFTTDVLIRLLYEDFLVQIRDEFVPDMIAKRLIEQKRHYYQKKPAGAGDYQRRLRWMVLSLQMKRELALRGEIFLHDVSVASPGFAMSLDELLSILFMDFIVEIQKGKQRELIRMIIDRLDQFE
ncbi:hypothetical protein [Cohnella sp. AR92]|uniref:hypothetical protein n=1 Tax=Cohnella sp. AR92 TaxID=648716 RepID=UPI000F8F5DF5|nr:hypothetical protein [Cohnella sp. AR92]RUS44995.1 hypothetical protein ELR57_22330 [Cohnella sp. AR92]